MWSVDPSWPPPTENRQRPHRAAYVFAAIMPLILVLAIAAPTGLLWGFDRLRNSETSRPGAAPSAAADEGQPGVGDPYFPDYGSSGYDAVKYQIMINWDVKAASMRSTTTITARATQDLSSFYFDLALQTDAVTVNGVAASFVRNDFQDVEVTPATVITSGSTFEVMVDYSGEPGRLKRGDTVPWRAAGQEWAVAGEPESAAWWFPSNDHPSDPALMDVSVRVPAGMEAISVGRLESADTGTEADFDTWHWISRQPMASYLNFVAIGQFDLQQGVVDGRPYVYAVSQQLATTERQQAFAALQKSGSIIKVLEQMFGPYPFTEVGGVVVATDLPFAGLETQTRPVYERSAILDGGFGESLIVHELAHMWFGNNVTLRQWNDIFNNEAYAAWAQWGYAERTGGRKANDSLNRLYDRAKDSEEFWQVTMIDPGSERLFDTVYSRGPMTVQALRNAMGDEAFFALARDWSQQPGSRSLEEWMITAQSKTTVDLVPLFQAWIFAPTAPARTAVNGFRP